MELTVRPGGDDLCESAIHVWPRRGFFLVALPNADKTFKCTLVLRRYGAASFGDLRTEDDLRHFMRCNFPDIVSGFSGLDEEFTRHPIGRITTVSCDPLHWRDSVLLLGDAAHTVAPFLGQGINLGFEGCLVLHQLLTRHPDRALALQQYSQERTVNARAAAALSLANYTELTHTETMPWVVAIRQLRNALHRLLARHLDPPAVVLVNFLDLTYSEAFTRLDKHRMPSPGLASAVRDASHQLAARVHP
jgi:kynurenine 3-monooxygenase